jgi:hypothetical protein
MGYRNESNYTVAPINEPFTESQQSNPPFTKYFQGNIRFLEAQAELDKNPQSFQLSRGYIRNLKLPVINKTTIYKCKFQFNPQEIKQSVSMREDMYLAILQDPAQLAQPIGAQMNFQFDLFFDRQYEMSRGTNAKVDPFSAVSVNTVSGDPYQISDPTPYDIGVYADLRVLYAVIGQGFNKNLIDQQLQTTAAGAARVFSNNSSPASTGTTTDTTGSQESTFSFNDADAMAALTANIGNAAILMPNPVRVMFSGLLMVDGFVTATQVDFLKFNTKMVPVQCRVTINMNAVYVGFATEDSFLTIQFNQAIKELEDQKARSEAANKGLAGILQSGVRSVTFGWGRDIDEATQKAKIDIFDTDKYSMFTLEQTGAKNYSERNFFFRFNDVIPRAGAGADTDIILEAYELGQNLTVTYNWTYTVYGFENTSNTQNQIFTAAQCVNVNTGEIDSTQPGYDVNFKVLGSYSGSKSASSKDEWGSGASGEGANWSKARRYSRHDEDDDENINNADGAPGEEGPGNSSTYLQKSNSRLPATGYCLVIWTLELLVQKDDFDPVYPDNKSTGNGQYPSGNKLVIKKVVSNSSRSVATFSFHWPWQ